MIYSVVVCVYVGPPWHAVWSLCIKWCKSHRVTYVSTCHLSVSTRHMSVSTCHMSVCQQVTCLYRHITRLCRHVTCLCQQVTGLCRHVTCLYLQVTCLCRQVTCLCWHVTIFQVIFFHAKVFMSNQQFLFYCWLSISLYTSLNRFCVNWDFT